MTETVLSRPKVTERIIISGDDNGGMLMVMEISLSPGGLVAPEHVHTREDETIYVVEGRVGWLLDGDTGHAQPRDALFCRRDVPHTFWNDGKGSARMIIVVTPGNLDRYFRGVKDLGEAGDAPDMRALLRHADSFGIELRMESLWQLSARYGVSLF